MTGVNNIVFYILDESLAIVAESWVYIADPSKVPDVGAVVHFPNGSNVRFILSTAKLSIYVFFF